MRIKLCWAIGSQLIPMTMLPWLAGCHSVTAAPTQTVEVVKNVSLKLPATWRERERGRNSLELVSTAPTDAKVILGRTLIVTENRTSAQEAVERLGDIAAEETTAATLTTIDGWPAIERQIVVTLPRVGDDRVQKPVAPIETVTVRTVAIAIGTTIVRLETTLAPQANTHLLDEIDARQALSITLKGDPARSKTALEVVQRVVRARLTPVQLPVPPSPREMLELAAPPARVGSTLGEFRPTATTTGATAVQQGVGELEVTASNDGRNVVIAANSGFSNSSDSGRSYTSRGALPAPFPSDGDPSLAVGASSNFYLGWIGFPNGTPAANNVTGCSNSLARSTDNGQNFTFRGHMIVCPNTGSVCFPDQEHIAADRVNQASGNDQIYNVWRNFTPSGTATSCGSIGSGFVTPRIVCSTNGGTSFGAPTNVGTGDFPRVTVGRDGFVYVVYISGSSVVLNKFSSCASGLSQQTGFPVTVGSFTAPPCPIPGLDRCNDGNTLASPTVAVDDGNANHVYVAWATSSGSGNENIIVADSTNGGGSFPRNVRVSGSATARRYMPWVCATGGAAHVGWYDRRSATSAANDRTRYWGGTAAVASSGLVAGWEYDMSGADDAECSTWPCRPRASGDSESCSVQPQLAGVCCTNPAPPATPVCGSTRCDLSAPTTCPAGNTCKLGGGCPKYGDYNGVGCASGRVYHAWSSATPPAGATSPGAGINVYAGVRTPASGVGAIWISTGTACSGDSCPGWTELDNNTKTLAITAGDDGTLYQLHRDGWIWRATGTACTGDSCPGWQRLDNNSKTVAIAAGNSLYQLHHDGWIWRYTGTPCSGDSCPGWQRLDNNHKTVAIAAAGNNLYQLHHDGWIWRYTGTPCSGESCPGWQRLDNNPKTVAIVAAGDALYQLHNDGWIWRYTNTPCSGESCPGWQRLDNNAKTVAIAAGGNNLYQLHNDGWIWRYTGTPCSGESCPGWQRLDNNPKTIAIVAAGNNLFQFHNDGWIWRYTGTPCSGESCPGWQRLDNNPSAFLIAAGGSQLYQLHADPIYQLHSSGRIWRYTGPRCDGDFCPGWQMLDNNPNTATIVAAGRQLFQLHRDGKIWRHTGVPCSGESCPGWQMLDNNPHTMAIVASDHELYQLHNDGKIWRHTGVACSGTSCPGWQMFDNNPAARAIAVAGRQLFQLHSDGSIWRATGVPCSGTSCPGWQRLDNNPATTAIAAAGRQLFQLHNDGSIWRSTGAPCSGNSCPGWQRLDNNRATTAIVAAGRQLFQLHNNGEIWRSTGAPCSGTSCPGWQRLDNNPNTRNIAASGIRLAQRHQSGWIWKSLGEPCSGASCPSWQRLDDNAATTTIVVGGFGNGL